MPKQTEILIIVNGGCVQEVQSTDENIKVILRDLDTECNAPTHLVKEIMEDLSTFEYDCYEEEVDIKVVKEIPPSTPIVHEDEGEDEDEDEDN